MSGFHALAEAMRRHGQSPGNSKSPPRYATISSYDPATHCVKVMIQPENVESNWMPLGAAAVGNGFGILSAPNIGDQVRVSFVEGDFNSGVVDARLFSNQAMPPNVPAGETWIVHQSGSALKFHNDGTVELISASDLNATVGGNLNANVTGNASITAAGNMLLKAINLTVNAVVTFTKAVTVQGLFTYQSGMSGSNGSGGAGAAINGGITNSGGSITSNSISLEGHHHTAQGATAPTSVSQA